MFLIPLFIYWFFGQVPVRTFMILKKRRKISLIMDFTEKQGRIRRPGIDH